MQPGTVKPRQGLLGDQHLDWEAGEYEGETRVDTTGVRYTWRNGIWTSIDSGVVINQDPAMTTNTAVSAKETTVEATADQDDVTVPVDEGDADTGAVEAKDDTVSS
jgi:hypothetical protein